MENFQVLCEFATNYNRYADNLSGDFRGNLCYDRCGGVYMNELHEKLEMLLKNYEWTQARLAKRMNVSPDAVSSWVRGKNHLSIETVKKLCVLTQKLTHWHCDLPLSAVVNVIQV